MKWYSVTEKMPIANRKGEVIIRVSTCTGGVSYHVAWVSEDGEFVFDRRYGSHEHVTDWAYLVPPSGVTE